MTKFGSLKLAVLIVIVIGSVLFVAATIKKHCDNLEAYETQYVRSHSYVYRLEHKHCPNCGRELSIEYNEQSKDPDKLMYLCSKGDFSMDLHEAHFAIRSYHAYKFRKEGQRK